MQLIFVTNMDADEVLRSLAVITSVVAFTLLNATTDVQHRPIGGTTYVYQVLAMVVTFRILQITHHSVVLFHTVRSAFYFPHSAFSRHPKFGAGGTLRILPSPPLLSLPSLLSPPLPVPFLSFP